MAQSLPLLWRERHNGQAQKPGAWEAINLMRSTCRLAPVLAKILFKWVRTVPSEIPCFCAIAGAPPTSTTACKILSSIGVRPKSLPIAASGHWRSSEALRTNTATQADRALQRLDEEDGAYLAGLLSDALRSIAPSASESALSAFSQLTMTLIAAAVRHAITLDAKESKCILTLFKRLLPKDLAVLA